MQEILSYFPQSIREKLQEYPFITLEEIRVRNGKPIFLKMGQEEKEIAYFPKTEEILEILQRICNNSIYTYQNQICNGYVTIRGWSSHWYYR